MSKPASTEPKTVTQMLTKSVAVVALTTALGGCAALPAIGMGATLLGSLPAIASLPEKISNFFRGSSTQTADAPVAPHVVTEADFLRGGDSLRARGDFATAAWFYGRAADANPNSIDARLRLASAQYALKDDGDAYTNYRAVLMLSPNDAEAAMRLGEIELRHGDAQSALGHFAVAIHSRQSDPKLYNLMGVAFTIQGKYEMARQSFDAGMKLDPQYLALQNNYGMMQLQSGDYQAALATFTRLVQSPGANERYRTNRALVEVAMGDTDAALVDAPGMDEPILRRTLARYQPKHEPIQVAAAGNVHLDLAPHGSDAAAPALLAAEGLIAPTLVPEPIPAKVMQRYYDEPTPIPF